MTPLGIQRRGHFPCTSQKNGFVVCTVPAAAVDADRFSAGHVSTCLGLGWRMSRGRARRIRAVRARRSMHRLYVGARDARFRGYRPCSPYRILRVIQGFLHRGNKLLFIHGYRAQEPNSVDHLRYLFSGLVLASIRPVFVFRLGFLSSLSLLSFHRWMPHVSVDSSCPAHSYVDIWIRYLRPSFRSLQSVWHMYKLARCLSANTGSPLHFSSLLCAFA